MMPKIAELIEGYFCRRKKVRVLYLFLSANLVAGFKFKFLMRYSYHSYHFQNTDSRYHCPTDQTMCISGDPTMFLVLILKPFDFSATTTSPWRTYICHLLVLQPLSQQHVTMIPLRSDRSLRSLIDDVYVTYEWSEVHYYGSVTKIRRPRWSVVAWGCASLYELVQYVPHCDTSCKHTRAKDAIK